MEKKKMKKKRRAIIVDNRCGKHLIKIFSTIYSPNFSLISPGFNAEYYRSVTEAHLGTSKK
jgi:hypothetical protein